MSHCKTFKDLLTTIPAGQDAIYPTAGSPSHPFRPAHYSTRPGEAFPSSVFNGSTQISSPQAKRRSHPKSPTPTTRTLTRRERIHSSRPTQNPGIKMNSHPFSPSSTGRSTFSSFQAYPGSYPPVPSWTMYPPPQYANMPTGAGIPGGMPGGLSGGLSTGMPGMDGMFSMPGIRPAM